MSLSNAERQKRSRERIKARAEANSCFAEFVRVRSELLTTMHDQPNRSAAERAILSEMLTAETYETDEDGLEKQFAEMVSDIVVGEYRRRRPQKTP